MQYNDNEYGDGASDLHEAASSWLGADMAHMLTKDTKITQSEFFVMLLRMQGELITRFEQQMQQNREDSNTRFEAINKRFEDMQRYIEKRFEDMQRYIEKRFQDMQRYMDKRFEDMNERFKDMNERFKEMQHNMDKRFELMQQSMKRHFAILQWVIGGCFTLLGTGMIYIIFSS